jgi:hypothetical protein
MNSYRGLRLPVTFSLYSTIDIQDAMIESQTSPIPANSRRSQRVVARIRVEVQRQTDSDGFMSEVSHTLVVNAHGALIALAMKVHPNEVLAIKNWNSTEEKQSRVVRVGETEAATQNEVAIEFTEPAPLQVH